MWLFTERHGIIKYNGDTIFGCLRVALCEVLRLMTPALTQKTPNHTDDTSSNVKNTPHQSALKTPTL